MALYTNIVCGVDLSASSEVTGARSIELARVSQATLHFVHVVEHFPQDRSNEVIAPESTDPARYRENQAREDISKLAKRFGYSDAGIEVLFSTHSAWHEIVRFSVERKADLLVVGSRGTHGIAAILGSTANSIVNHAPCDVLVVRAEAVT